MSFRSHTPTVFKSVFANPSGAGDITLWTPAAGKRFRLLKYIIAVTRPTALATGQLVNFTLKDGATVLPFALTMWIPPAELPLYAFRAGSFEVQRGLYSGYLSAAVNNVLSVNIDAALNFDITCGARISTYGIEE